MRVIDVRFEKYCETHGIARDSREWHASRKAFFFGAILIYSIFYGTDDLSEEESLKVFTRVANEMLSFASELHMSKEELQGLFHA